MNKLLLRNQIDIYLTEPERVTRDNDCRIYEIDIDDLIEQLENDGFENLEYQEVMNLVLERLNDIQGFFKYE